MQIENDVRQVCADAAGNIEEQIHRVAEIVLDVVAEDPEKQHVAADMDPALVQKHAGDEGKECAFEADVPTAQKAGDVRRNSGVGGDERLILMRAQRELV